MMLSVLSYALLAVPFHIFPVTATQFCQCEHSAPLEWKFGGIQHICKYLSDDWCSTNCNSLGANCDYCQFKPAGQGPDADYQRLVSWCHDQQEWDSQAEEYVRGETVFCYSYKNRVPMKFGYSGCPHEDNGDDPRDQTAYYSSKLEGGWYQRRGCSNLQISDWVALRQKFIQQHPKCQIVDNSTFSKLLDCPYSSNPKDNLQERQDFKDDCQERKGQFFLRHDGPGPILLQETTDQDSSQRVLSIPGRYPPTLLSSTKQHDSKINKDSDWIAEKSKGDRISIKDDLGEKGHQENHGRTTRVAFEDEETGMKVILVEEEF